MAMLCPTTEVRMMMPDEDSEEDEFLCFRVKRNSTANVVREDDDEMPIIRKKRRKTKAQLIRKMLLENDELLKEWDVPPVWSDEVGDVDYSEAALVVVDGPALKTDPKPFCCYDWLLEFANLCRRKCCLQQFHHPGDPSMGGIGCKQIRRADRAMANFAIKKYQEVSQNVKLQLRDLMRINYKLSGCYIFYLTFSAQDEMTGEIRPYQAVLAKYSPDNFLLGLFRDLLDDKILAILSVKGSEEDLAERRAEMQNDKQKGKKAKRKRA